MANTLTQIHLQFVFAVQNRISLIADAWKHDLYKYITTIVQNNDHKMLALNGIPDHLHLLIGMRPAESISRLMQEIKGDSSGWVNKKKFTKGRFQWQEGYGAFSYSKSHLPDVVKYIKNQELHHKQKTFIEEYKQMLNKFEIPYDERYIFKQVL
jgi:REP element-mobilizing transposase RayT